MTKIENVFMLSINARLDYQTLREVCVTGHSRVPVYEEIDLPATGGQAVKAKKIVGVLLVKQVCHPLHCLGSIESDSHNDIPVPST
jgi:metal transporter CNNM